MTKKLRIWLIFLIFLNGYISLSLELVVLRGLSFYVGSSAVITSIIMGTFLGFMSLGYVAGTSQKINRGRIRNILAASFIVISFFALLAASFPMITDYFTLMQSWGIRSGVIQTFLFSGLLLSVGPFLFGFNTTLLSRCLHTYNTNYTGNIMAWDTIGSVIGSMATTLILMPFIGVNYTVTLIIALSLIAAIVTRPNWMICTLGVIIFIPTLLINSNYYQMKKFGILIHNANSTISVRKYNDGATRVLDMNGLPMSVYHPDVRLGADYINYINQIYLYTMPQDRVRRVLVLGAGGFTAGLNDKFHDYTFVDIERTLKDVSEKHFLGENVSPNKRFIVQDASQFLMRTPNLYDVIILDVYTNSYQIPEGLITAEFMSRIKSRIAPDGIIIMNMIVSASFSDNYSRVFDNTFNTVFPHNTTRQVIGYANPYAPDDTVNVLYIYHNRENSGRIYTINKTPVIYDR